MKNQELIIRDIQGDFMDCINIENLKETIKESNEVFLSSFFEDSLSLKISFFGNEFFLKCESFPVESFKNFPMKRINKLINDLKIDTIEIL